MGGQILNRTCIENDLGYYKSKNKSATTNTRAKTGFVVD